MKPIARIPMTSSTMPMDLRFAYTLFCFIIFTSFVLNRLISEIKETLVVVCELFCIQVNLYGTYIRFTIV